MDSTHGVSEMIKRKRLSEISDPTSTFLRLGNSLKQYSPYTFVVYWASNFFSSISDMCYLFTDL